MDSGESPAVARRRVRLALRAAREAKGFTQGHVAQELDWSLSKVNRIEKGDVTVSRTDLLAMLEMYGVDDLARVDDLVRAARVSRRRGWWDESRYRDHHTSATLQMLQFESEATAIRHFHPMLVAGLLQTREYAECIMNFWKTDISEVDRVARLETRMLRREQVLGRADPPDFYFVIDESVTYREVGGPGVMAEQLRQLLELMKKPNIRVRVIPFAAAAIVATLGPFTLMDFGDEEDAVLYREVLIADEVVHARDIVHRHREYFEHMWTASLSEDASARLIEARAAVMLSSLDRRPGT
jgi:transcriptional regulator with XRE-family HTH domain